MRTVVEKFNVYKFDELNKESQEKAIKLERQYRSEDDCFSQGLADYVEETLMSEGLHTDVTVSFDLNYVQGRGLSFTGSVTDENEFLKSILDKELYEKYMYFNRLCNLQTYIKFTRFDNDYQHEMTTQVDLEHDYLDNFLVDGEGYRDITTKEENEIEEIMDEIRDELDSYRYGRCKQLFRTIEKNWEEYMEDSSIIEYFESEGIEFYENGKVYND